MDRHVSSTNVISKSDGGLVAANKRSRYGRTNLYIKENKVGREKVIPSQ